MNSLQIQNNGFIEKGLKDCITSIKKTIKYVNLLEKSDKPEIIKNIKTNTRKEMECFVSLFNAVSNLRDTMESATISSSLYNDLVNVKGELSDLRQSAKKSLSKNVIDFYNYILTRVMQALETPSGSDIKSTKDNSYILNKIKTQIEIKQLEDAYDLYQNISFYCSSSASSSSSDSSVSSDSSDSSVSSYLSELISVLFQSVGGGGGTGGSTTSTS